MNFKDALSYSLKVLEIHKNYLGHNSVEVAEDRRVLGVICSGLDEHENALEQNLLSQRVLKNWGRSKDLLRAEIDAANMQIALGRYEVALNTLKNVVQKTDKDSEDRAMIFTSMAKALCFLEKFNEAKKCLEIFCGIYGKKEKSSPVVAVEAFMEISIQCETMIEFEPVISLLKRAFAILDKLPQEQHSVGSVCARIGWLFLLTGSVDQAIPYFEDAAERLKESFGSRHLGAAYLELDRPQSAAQAFAYAKEIMDVALDPHHVDSIEACQNLSKAYATMKSIPLAINFHETAVERLKGHGPSVQNELDEAVRVLEQLRDKVSAEFSETLIKALPPPQGDDQVSIDDSNSGIDALIKALPPLPQADESDDEAVSINNPNTGIWISLTKLFP